MRPERRMETKTTALRERTRTEHEPGPDPFLRRVFTAAGIGVLAVLLLGMLVLGVEILLAAFAGILGAVFLLVLRDFLVRHTGSPRGGRC